MRLDNLTSLHVAVVLFCCSDCRVIELQGSKQRICIFTSFHEILNWVTFKVSDTDFDVHRNHPGQLTLLGHQCSFVFLIFSVSVLCNSGKFISVFLLVAKVPIKTIFLATDSRQAVF